MEGAEAKTAAPKAVYEESYIPTDAERSRSSLDKDTTERTGGVKSKRKSTAAMAVELDDKSNETESPDANKILNNNASTPVNLDVASAPSASSPRQRSGESRSPRISTRASVSTPSRRSTRTSSRNELVEGLKDASPSNSSRSSGSKPLRDSTGRFISKKIMGEGGHDRVTTEEPPKQALDTSESLEAEEKEISGDKERGELQRKNSSAIATGSPPVLKPKDTPAAKQPPKSEVASKQHKVAEIATPAALPQPEPQRSNSDSAAGENRAAAPVPVEATIASPSKDNHTATDAPPQQNSVSDSAPTVKTKPIPPSSETSISRNAEVQSSEERTEPTSRLLAPPESTDAAVSNVPAFAAPEPKPPPAAIPAMTSPPTVSQVVVQAADEAAIYAARAPLSNLYGQYICKSTDASLDDARSRLRKAIAQTRELRKLFTDRVYDKYRV